MSDCARYFKNPTEEQLEIGEKNKVLGGAFFIESKDKGGKFVVPHQINLVQALSVEHVIDLSVADFVTPVVHITITSVMAGCNIKVPRGLKVVTKGNQHIEGAEIVGGFDGPPVTEGTADGPMLIISGVSLLGTGVEVKVNEDVPPLQIVE